MLSSPDAKVASCKAVQYIARQPILNADKGIFAYELLYRDSEKNAFPIGTTDGQATGRVFFNALMLVGLEKLTGNQRAFINLSTDSFFENLPKLLQPRSVVIEIVERADNLIKLTKKMRALKEDGYSFALDDYAGDEKWEPLLALVDYIKLEVQSPLIKTNMMIRKLKRRFPELKIIVERIETYEQFLSLKRAGCDYFQGFFFARPEMLSYQNVEPSKFAVFDLLRCTANPHFQFDDIHQRISKDVGLTARILKLVNARSREQSLEITSISQAIIYLGEDAIRQFVRVLALSELGLDKPTELTKLGLIRAHFMQSMLKSVGADMAEKAYLVGLMSVLDAMLDMQLSVIAKEFCLSHDLTSALVDFEGVLGLTLQLAKTIEEDDLFLAEKLFNKTYPAQHIELAYKAMLNARTYGDQLLATIIE